MPFPTLLPETPHFPLNSGEQARPTYLSRDSEIARSPRTAHAEIRPYHGLWWVVGLKPQSARPQPRAEHTQLWEEGASGLGRVGPLWGGADIYGHFI